MCNKLSEGGPCRNKVLKNRAELAESIEKDSYREAVKAGVQTDHSAWQRQILAEDDRYNQELIKINEKIANQDSRLKKVSKLSSELFEPGYMSRGEMVNNKVKQDVQGNGISFNNSIESATQKSYYAASLRAKVSELEDKKKLSKSKHDQAYYNKSITNTYQPLADKYQAEADKELSENGMSEEDQKTVQESIKKNTEDAPKNAGVGLAMDEFRRREFNKGQALKTERQNIVVASEDAHDRIVTTPVLDEKELKSYRQNDYPQTKSGAKLLKKQVEANHALRLTKEDINDKASALENSYDGSPERRAKTKYEFSRVVAYARKRAQRSADARGLSVDESETFVNRDPYVLEMKQRYLAMAKRVDTDK